MEVYTFYVSILRELENFNEGKGGTSGHPHFPRSTIRLYEMFFSEAYQRATFNQHLKWHNIFSRRKKDISK